MLKGLFDELCTETHHLSLFCDYQSAIFLSKDQMFHEHTKCINAHYHSVHDIFFSSGDVAIKKISTHENQTYMMVKSLVRGKLEHCLNLIGLHS